jgi:autotransporter-associated beta strand protein
LLLEPLEDRLAPAIVTWDGGGADDNWTTAANWVGDVAPGPGDDLIFTGAVRLTPNNNFAPNTPFRSITFNADNFTVRGNPIVLGTTGGGVSNNTGANNRLELGLFLGTNPQTFSIAPGTTLTFAGALGGPGQLTKAGGGTLVLGGTTGVSATGLVLINAGTVRLTTATALAATNRVRLAEGAGATLDLNGNNLTLAGLEGGGGAPPGQVMLGTATLTIDGTVHGSFDGVISGMGGLVKRGSSNLALGGVNTYTGATTVNGGSLLVNGSTAAASAVTVNSGGTLGGRGIINGTVTVNAGGTVAPGGADALTRVGALRTGSLTFAANSTLALNFDSSSSFDILFVTGTLNLGGANLTGAIASGFDVNGLTFGIVTASGAVTGMFASGAQVVIGGKTFSITYNANNVVLTNLNGVKTWTGAGADNNWSTLANWGGLLPRAGDDLVFPTTARLTANNDLAADTVFSSLTFTGSGVNLTGNALRLSVLGGGVFNNSGSNSVSLNLRLVTNAQALSAAAGTTLTITGSINNDSELIVNAVGTVTTTGRIDGERGLRKFGSGTLNLLGFSAFGPTLVLGATTIAEGTVFLSSAGTLGSTLGQTDVLGGATLIVQGSVVDELIFLQRGATMRLRDAQLYGGPGPTQQDLIVLFDGARLIAESGESNLNGRLTLERPETAMGGGIIRQTRVRIQVAAGAGVTVWREVFLNGAELTFEGAGISRVRGVMSDGQGTASSVIKDGPGELQIYDNNTYTGVTEVRAGTFRLVTTPQHSARITGIVNRIDVGAQLVGDGELGETVTVFGTLGRLDEVGNYRGFTLALAPNSTFNVLMAGGSSFTQFRAANNGSTQETVLLGDSLRSATLNVAFAPGFTPFAGQTFTIINNEDNDAVIGTFAGLPEGMTFAIGPVVFQISYVGGDGNDVVLTAIVSPIPNPMPGPGPGPGPGPVTPQPGGDVSGMFVIALYQSILGRLPDQGGFNFWTSQVRAGANRVQVALALWTSAEHRSQQVDQLYRRILNRPADPGGLNTWVNAMLRGLNENDVALALLTSPEYSASHASNTAFVQGLYEDVLRRTGSAAEVARYVSQLDAGTLNRAQVARAFLFSTEALTNLVRADYRAFLGREPDASGLQNFVTRLAQGLDTPTTLAATLLGSEEYFRRVTGSNPNLILQTALGVLG